MGTEETLGRGSVQPLGCLVAARVLSTRDSVALICQLGLLLCQNRGRSFVFLFFCLGFEMP